jgi:hypothetical protein
MTNIRNFKQKRFIMIPINALSELTESNTATLFNYGIVEFAKGMRISLDNAIQELIYDWYHRTDDLTESLRSFLTQLMKNDDGWLLADEDYRGFVVGEFDPIDDAATIKPIILDHNMEGEVKQYAAIKKAQKLFEVKHINADIILNNHKQIKPCPVFGKVPVKVFWMLIKDEITIEAFKMYAAILSIEGNKLATYANKPFINTRMMGEIRKTDKELPTRRHNDKHIKELMDLTLVAMTPSGRGWYLSTSLSKEELVRRMNDKAKRKTNKLVMLQKKHPQLETIEN